jgi:hypothetical protein
METGNDTDHNDQRNTISYSFIGNSFTQPHDKHTSGCKDESPKQTLNKLGVNASGGSVVSKTGNDMPGPAEEGSPTVR